MFKEAIKRLLWVFLSGALFLTALVNFFSCQHRLHNTFEQARERLMLIASNSAQAISADEVYNVPLEQKSDGTPEYLLVYNKLLKIKENNPLVKYAYIMTATNQPGVFKYVVDADPLPQIITAKCLTSLPGDKYDASRFPEMLEAYKGPSADRKIATDEWGIFISGYSPIKDANGRTAAILGVDIDAAFIQLIQKRVQVAGHVAIATGILFLLLFAGALAKP